MAIKITALRSCKLATLPFNVELGTRGGGNVRRKPQSMSLVSHDVFCFLRKEVNIRILVKRQTRIRKEHNAYMLDLCKHCGIDET